MLQLTGMPLLISPVAAGAVITPHGQYNVSRTSARGNGAIHKGVDLAVDDGDAIYAALGGVVRTGYDAPANVDPVTGVNSGGGGGGNFIGIKSGPWELMYMHLQSVLVSSGKVVNQGDQIALGGHSGSRVSGAHLHFEIRKPDSSGNRNNIDPTDYLPIGGASPFVEAGGVTDDGSGLAMMAAVAFAVWILWGKLS